MRRCEKHVSIGNRGFGKLVRIGPFKYSLIHDIRAILK
jgi:hypothetical protein